MQRRTEERASTTKGTPPGEGVRYACKRTAYLIFIFLSPCRRGEPLENVDDYDTSGDDQNILEHE